MSVSPTEDALIVALDFEGALLALTYVIPWVQHIILHSTPNRCAQLQTFLSGGRASRSFQDRYF